MSSEVFSTPRSCDSTSLVPGEFLKITWMKQKTVEQGPGLPWLGGRANSAFPWCCSMINRDKERKERRKLINTIGIPARICLSQVIRILTSCLEKKTGNKSLGDKICLGGWSCTRLTQPWWGSPKSCFSQFSWVSNQQQEPVASMETPLLVPVLLSPSCSHHPTPGKSRSKGSSRWREFISCQVISAGQTLGGLGWAPAGCGELWSPDGRSSRSRASPTPLSEGPGSGAAGAGALPNGPTLHRGSSAGMGCLGIHSRNFPVSMASTGQVWEAGVRSLRNVSPQIPLQPHQQHWEFGNCRFTEAKEIFSPFFP